MRPPRSPVRSVIVVEGLSGSTSVHGGGDGSRRAGNVVSSDEPELSMMTWSGGGGGGREAAAGGVRFTALVPAASAPLHRMT